MKPVVILEAVKLCVVILRNGQGSITKRALEEMEKTRPRFTDLAEAPRGGLSDSPQVRHPLGVVGSTPTLAKIEYSAKSPYSQISKPDYSGASQISAAGKGCIPCGNDHFSTAAAALSESIRFARTGGIEHPEVVSRITLAVDELNAFERIDGAPEKVDKLPPVEKKMMDDMMTASRAVRHLITDIKTLEDLEKTTAVARRYRIEFMLRQIQMQTKKVPLEKAKPATDGVHAESALKLPRTNGVSPAPQKDGLNPEFFFDSKEQITQSLDGNGLRAKLDKAFEEAIAKVQGRV